MDKLPQRTATDVIAAIATPAGRGGVGIVRISGPGLLEFAQAITGRQPAPRKAVHTQFIDASGEAIDEGIVLYFASPASYTGEDVLELQGHGGPVVLQMLLKRCMELGARLAEPGEFTRRAFLNEKLDLAQAEGVADLIEAATETAARSALRSLRGEFSARVAALVEQLLEVRILVEAMLDFPDEDVERLDRIEAQRRLNSLQQALDEALSQAKQGSILRTGLQVVLAGRPNVGKSSLLNRLAGEDLAIVTPIPGTTRDAVRQTIQIEGVPLHIVDTAGLRKTADEVESIGIKRTWDAVGGADLVLLILEADKGMTEEDEALAAQLPAKLKRLTVYNKLDLAESPPDSMQRDCAAVRVSALTGVGLDALRRKLLSSAGWIPGGEDVLLARERHLVALKAAAEHLSAAGERLGRPELLAEELRLAHNSLASITGEFSADDLLGEIFSRFCIGK